MDQWEYWEFLLAYRSDAPKHNTSYGLGQLTLEEVAIHRRYNWLIENNPRLNAMSDVDLVLDREGNIDLILHKIMSLIYDGQRPREVNRSLWNDVMNNSSGDIDLEKCYKKDYAMWDDMVTQYFAMACNEGGWDRPIISFGDRYGFVVSQVKKHVEANVK